VDPSTSIATIVELSPVWVIADVHERDVARVRLGAAAVVTMESYPGIERRGRVTYIAPDVRPETRTTQLRIEVRNDEATLRFGMFVMVEVQEGVPAAAEVGVPRSAIQTVGAQTVVYVADRLVAGRFAERPVVLGTGDALRVTVRSGVRAGEQVASDGTFALRAEAERLGRSRYATIDDEEAGAESASVAVSVTAQGFDPQTIRVPHGRATRITFTRTTDQTCATEVIVPGYNIRQALPLNAPVTIEFAPRRREPLSFQCGMGMLKGAVLVQ
jgi:hypothetical protein